jgi:hypothetical protein
MEMNIFRIHAHGDDIHFHDDRMRLKARVPMQEFQDRYSSWISTPAEPLIFEDRTQATRVVMSCQEANRRGIAEIDLIVEIVKTPVS